MPQRVNSWTQYQSNANHAHKELSIAPPQSHASVNATLQDRSTQQLRFANVPEVESSRTMSVNAHQTNHSGTEKDVWPVQQVPPSSQRTSNATIAQKDSL